MSDAILSAADRIQAEVAKLLATQPEGRQLCLIGGFRYRLLDGSCRRSQDIDYHWEGDLAEKQRSVAELLKRRLLPEIKRKIGYDGDVRCGGEPMGESPVVEVVELAFYALDRPGSRLEIPLEITRIPCLDRPMVRTVDGTVYLTVSDADMVESKAIALLNRPFTQARDFLDLFLFQNQLQQDSDNRLKQKFQMMSLSPRVIVKRLDHLSEMAAVHEREIDQIIETQVDPNTADHLTVAGGGKMVRGLVWRLLIDRLKLQDHRS